MITRGCYRDIWFKFNSLKNSPTIKSRLSNYKLYSAFFDNESFQEAFELWVVGNDIWPTHSDLKKALAPKLFKFNYKQLKAAKKNTQAWYIWDWIKENLEIPIINGYSWETRTQSQEDIWTKQFNIAIHTFYKKAMAAEINVIDIITGEVYLKKIHVLEVDKEYGCKGIHLPGYALTSREPKMKEGVKIEITKTYQKYNKTHFEGTFSGKPDVSSWEYFFGACFGGQLDIKGNNFSAVINID